MILNGAGKYDGLCTYVREQADADGAIVIIFNGNKGGGFSVQANGSTLLVLPSFLEQMAKQMRIDDSDLH